MIDIRYTELFRLEVHHAYLGGLARGAVEIRPAWRAAPPGLATGRYHAEGPAGAMFEAGAEARSALGGPAPLPFWLVASDPALAAYTALPGDLSSADALVRLDNRAPAATGRRVVIQDADTPLRRLAVRPSAFRHALPPGVEGQRLEVIRAADTALVLDRIAPDGRPFAGALDVALPAAPDGRYRLRLDGATELDFVLARTAPRGTFALLEVYAGGPDQALPPGARSIGEDGRRIVPPPIYEIRLAARRTRWRYWLRPRTGTPDLSGWRVHVPDGAADLRFRAPERAPAGAPAPWRVESEVPLALAVRAASGSELRAPDGGRRIPLPLPGPASLAREADELVCEVVVQI
jgi:hypothetical protein